MLEKWLKWVCCLLTLVLVVGCGNSVYYDLSEEAGVKASTESLDEERCDSDIPRIYLKGDISEMREKTDVRTVSAEYRDGNRSITAYAKLKVQGGSSMGYVKKNYTIKFFRDKSCSEKKKIDFGWGGQSQYCLKANWTDKTHARNIVAARLAAEIQGQYDVMRNAPNHGLVDGFPVEVYSNGDFLGLYTLNIPKDAWLFGMDKDKRNHLVFYGETWEPAGLFDALPDFEHWSIEVGAESDVNMNKLSRLFSFVINSTDEEFRKKFSEYLDLDSTLTYIIMVNLGMMYDNLGKNMLLVSYDGNVWYPSLYDLDSAWGVDYRSQKMKGYTQVPVSDGNRLLRRVRENFSEELAERYFELRKTILSREHIMQEFYDFRAGIPEQTFEKERKQWGEIPGFEYDQIEEYLDIRLPVLDAYMGELLK